jgi:hypothetical protein
MEMSDQRFVKKKQRVQNKTMSGTSGFALFSQAIGLQRTEITTFHRESK